MAKRFTDTEKWKREWFLDLPTKMKVFWEYMRDMCDHAGIFLEAYRRASTDIGETITRDEVELHFGRKVIRIDHDKLFMPAFIEFQYDVSKDPQSRKMNPKNKAHLGVIRQLLRYKIDPSPWLPPGFDCASLTSPFEAPPKGLASTSEGAQEKDKEKEKEKEGGYGGKQSCELCGGAGTLEALDRATGFPETFRCSCLRGAKAGNHAWPRWSAASVVAYEARPRSRAVA